MSYSGGSFHFLQGTSVVGPLQYGEMERLVQKGVISADTMLSADATNWMKAIDLAPQLFVAKDSITPTTGAERWFVQSNGQQYGPISYTELLGWVSSKSVVAETLVRKSENGAWQRADTVFPHLQLRTLTPRQPVPQSRPDGPTPVSQGTSKHDATLHSSHQVQESTSDQVFAAIGLFAVIAVVYVVAFFVIFVGLPQLRLVVGPGGLLIGYFLLNAIRSALSKGGRQR